MKAPAPVLHHDPFPFPRPMVVEWSYHSSPMQPHHIASTINTSHVAPDETDLEVVNRFLREFGVPESRIVGGWLELRGFLCGIFGLFIPFVFEINCFLTHLIGVFINGLDIID